MRETLWEKVCLSCTERVRDWYRSAYPDDELGKNIDPQIEFIDVALYIDTGVDIYFLLGVTDSVVRERVFSRLSELSGIPYETIYNRWIQV